MGRLGICVKPRSRIFWHHLHMVWNLLEIASTKEALLLSVLFVEIFCILFEEGFYGFKNLSATALVELKLLKTK